MGESIPSRHGPLVVVRQLVSAVPESKVQEGRPREHGIFAVVGGGCRLDRDLPSELRTAHFEIDELEAEYGEGPRWLSFTYQGVARPWA